MDGGRNSEAQEAQANYTQLTPALNPGRSGCGTLPIIILIPFSFKMETFFFNFVTSRWKLNELIVGMSGSGNSNAHVQGHYD